MLEKCGVLEGSGICRILPAGASESAGEKPRTADQTPVLTFSVGFVAEKWIVLGGF